MKNNDILRSIRYSLSLGDAKMMAIFAQSGYHVSREQVCNWLKKDEDPEWQNCTDLQLAHFLDGLILEKRGKKEGVQVAPEKRLNNNIVFRKLKIAFDLKALDVLQLLELAGLPMSEHELSAFFRKPGHKHYRPCKDQVLRNFLKGLQLHHRPQPPEEAQRNEWPGL